MPEVSSQALDDLWGRSFTEQHHVPEPVRILKQQAERLTERTEGRIEGVVRERMPSDGTVWVGLWARVPAARNYEHKLLTITYAVDAIDPELPFPMTVFGLDGEEVKLQDRDEFLAWLTSTLSSSEVHELINRLLWYSKDEFQSAG